MSSGSTWEDCQAQGCTLPSSINCGQFLCTYHSQTDKADAGNVSMAIAEHMQYLNKHARMMRWSSRNWTQNQLVLKNDDYIDCQRIFGDIVIHPRVYLHEYHAETTRRIMDRATELATGYVTPRQENKQLSDDGLWGN